MTTCRERGCERPSHVRGLCHACYARQRRHGLLQNVPRQSRAERFWSKVAVTEPDACWPWQAHVDAAGYGRFRLGRVAGVGYAHRVAYEMTHGVLPAGLEVDHLCRYRRCVNPAHLEAVTHRENGVRGGGATARAHRDGTCVNGHSRSEHAYLRANGQMVYCRECRRERRRAARLT